MAKPQITIRRNKQGREVNHILHEESGVWMTIRDFAKKFKNINVAENTIITRINSGCDYENLLKPAMSPQASGRRGLRKRAKQGHPSFATGVMRQA